MALETGAKHDVAIGVSEAECGDSSHPAEIGWAVGRLTRIGASFEGVERGSRRFCSSQDRERCNVASAFGAAAPSVPGVLVSIKAPLMYGAVLGIIRLLVLTIIKKSGRTLFRIPLMILSDDIVPSPLLSLKTVFATAKDGTVLTPPVHKDAIVQPTFRHGNSLLNNVVLNIGVGEVN